MGKVRPARANTVSMECCMYVFSAIHSENRHCSTAQMMIFVRCGFQCLAIVIFSGLNGHDYYKSLNSGIDINSFIQKLTLSFKIQRNNNLKQNNSILIKG